MSSIRKPLVGTFKTHTPVFSQPIIKRGVSDAHTHTAVKNKNLKKKEKIHEKCEAAEIVPRVRLVLIAHPDWRELGATARESSSKERSNISLSSKSCHAPIS